jgi:hypothetical protein
MANLMRRRSKFLALRVMVETPSPSFFTLEDGAFGGF